MIGINNMLTAVFSNHLFCALTINMGPQTVCLPHYNYITLHKPKLVIELYRGDMMFITSAAVMKMPP